METASTRQVAADIPEFGSADFDARDESDMIVSVAGKPTTWVWTFAGPGHPQALAQVQRLSRERLHEDRDKEQARVNGKKWKAPDESPDEVRFTTIHWVVERIVTWSPVKIDGELLPFSVDAATKLLTDPRKGDLLTQAMEFLGSTDSFTKRSAKI